MNYLARHRNGHWWEVHTTILTRPKGTWSEKEISAIGDGLHTEVKSDAGAPESIVVIGTHTKDRIKHILMVCVDFNIGYSSDLRDNSMPFKIRSV